MVVSLLPPNATNEERAFEAAIARIEDVPVPIKDLMDPYKCPVHLLPFMAWQLSVDYWSPDWPEDIMRKVCAASLKVHQYKGTAGAVEDALAALDLIGEVRPWHTYGGVRGKFKVDVDLSTRGFTEAENSAAMAVILNAKNTRSHLDSLTIHLTSKSGVPSFGCALCATEEMTIYPYTIPPFIHSSSVPVCAVAMQSVETTTIYPRIN